MENEHLSTNESVIGVTSYRAETHNHKIILEEITKNTKELEAFLNLNLKFRNNLNEMVAACNTNNDESKILN
jgi:hypothetical protein